MEETEQNLHSGYGRGPGLECFCIVMACEQRGRVAFGGEYLILPAAILARLWIPEMIQSVTGVLEMPDEEEEDV